MSIELNLRFSGTEEVQIRLGSDDSGTLPFANPLTPKDREDIRWYLEVYGAHSLGDPDDKEAKRIKERLPEIGKALFDAVFGGRAAQRLFNQFQDDESEGRLLTVSAEHSSLLSLPWELLHDSAKGGVFLFRESPRISIRRRLAGGTGGRAPFKIKSKKQLRLLFVVSRPEDVGFLDPRADPGAVMDALEEHAPGRVTWEFLRPPTIDALTERLREKPAIDILHFDGHGVFDKSGTLAERAKKGDTRLVFDGEMVKEKDAEAPQDSDEGEAKGMGYLLFEDQSGKLDLVSAQQLGENLHRQKVGLVVLSACQTAALGDGDEPMSSVAARLTAAGIPAVLAMTHSVLVATTRTLFGELYRHLAQGAGVGEALDHARAYLDNHPEKYEVQRGPERKALKLHDWFLPALYQSGDDVPLLRGKPAEAATPEAPAAEVVGRVRERHEAGFFGRRRELWDVERWFAGETRRISITGFGGQGKTELALEAGRWLVRAGMFEQAVFVDYSQVQAEDALQVAVSNVGSVLDRTLAGAEEASAALAETPTLVILDNLEAVAPDPLRALLDAGVQWSLSGGSRVLLTTRMPDFNHAEYRVEGTRKHRRIALDGLGSARAPDAALEWFAALIKLPPPPQVSAPDRKALIELFDRVGFHPLSIRVLAQQLKVRRPAELGRRLEEILDQPPPAAGAGDTPLSLLASLQLSFDRLSEAERDAVRRLGVFQGGALDSELLAITELGESDEREEMQSLLEALEGGDPRALIRLMGVDLPDDAEIPAELIEKLPEETLREQADELRAKLAELPQSAGENLWPGLRRQLEAAALIEPESVPGVGPPFFRFHPTLAPMLWAQLDADEQAQLTEAHRQRYYALSGYLYQQDSKDVHHARAIAWRELPNLLHAVHRALDAGDPDAVEFADNVTIFLRNFSLQREAARLTARAEQAGGETGSQTWLLAQSNKGKWLLDSGHVAEAAQVFSAILQTLGDRPTYERAAALGQLGRCYEVGGRPDLAEGCQRDGIAVSQQLEQNDDVKRLRGVRHTDLADVLGHQGKFAEAREQYEESLAIKREIGGDLRGEGVVLGQLGTLAMSEGKLDEALERHREALALFQHLREPASEAVLWHQLGMTFQRAQQWDEAERHYRESARLKEEQGMLTGPNSAATTWNQLAIVSQNAGKPDAAETWYRKAIEVDRALGNPKELAPDLSNLAGLLQTQPDRLAEARQLAEEAVAIMRTLDPGASEIWSTYNILAEIADQESRPDQTAEFRRLAREAKRNFAGTRHELRQHLPVILGTLAAIQDPGEQQEFGEVLSGMEQHGWTDLVAAIRRILAGERDEETLCEGLDLEDSMIVETILQALADPSTLDDLLPDDLDDEGEDGGEG